ncbi:MAG TPA: hypothetical protein VJ650_14955 [Gemmatimonadaceae bacterium]|nr:hypothetical protein [Gemmatimonadaceae bacterium]
MLSKRTTLAVLCAAALVACDAADSLTGPSPSPEVSASLVPTIEIPEEFLPGVPVLDPFASIWNDDAGVTESARGGGHWQVATGLRTFAFTAKNRADGTVQGQYQVNNRDVSGSKEHGTVTCLEVVGNEAWIGGVITHSSIPAREGTRRLFYVVDRGEGSGDAPDQASMLGVTATTEECRLRTALPPQDLEGGNIQVRDGA